MGSQVMGSQQGSQQPMAMGSYTQGPNPLQ